MKFELKSIKVVNSLSEETTCFTARLYIDGKDAGQVSNRGHGGCHEWGSRDAERLLQAHADTLPDIVANDMADPKDPTKPFTYRPSADSLIDDLVTDHLIEGDLRRAMTTKILFVGIKDGKLREVTVSGKAPIKKQWLAGMLAKSTEALMAELKASAVLNAMPFAEALAVYKAKG